MKKERVLGQVLICLVLVFSLVLPGCAPDEGSTRHSIANSFSALPMMPLNTPQGQVTPMVAAGAYLSVGLKSDGTVVAVGDNRERQCDVGDWTDIIQVSAGQRHTVGLKSDGTVVATGQNWYGQCDVGDWTDIVQVTTGADHTVGLKSDGTVVAVGMNNFRQCNVGDWTDIVQVAAGWLHTVGLKPDGTMVVLGDNYHGQCNVGGWTDIGQVVAGWYHTVGVRTNGTAIATGRNEYGQCDVGDWTDIVQVAAHTYHTVGLKADGTVVAVGRNGQCDVEGWTGMICVAAGTNHTLGLRADGSVVVVGQNCHGQSNVGDWNLCDVPLSHNLTVSSTAGGQVTTPTEGTHTYEANTVVALLAVPDTGHQFVNWTGDVGTIDNVHAPETTITINDDYSIIANFAVTPPWPMFGQNAKRTGRSPYAGPETPGLRWSFTTQGWVTSSPAIGVDGTIYVGAHDYNLYAMNPDGSEKWRFTTGDSIYNSSPAIGPDGTVYVGSADGKIYAIDPDGSERWSFTTGGSIFSSPVPGVDGTIYVGSDDNNLYALRPDGDEEWRFATGDDVRSSPAIGIDGTIYVGSDYNLYALDPDGGEKWRFTTGEPVSVAPSIGADGMVYVGSQDGNLYAIDPDGDEKWRFTTGGVILSSPGIGIDGTVYVGSNDNNLYAINPDGSEKWRFTTGGSVLSSPAICANGIIYVGSGDNKLYAVDPDGSKKWSFTTGDWVTSSPAIGADGTIYVGSWDYRLYAIMEAPEYDLSISSTEGGEVTDPGEGTFTYAYGSVVNLVATPDTGHQFVNWTGDVGSVDSVDSAETTITMHDDYAIIANFAINTYTLTYSAGPGGSITGTTPQTVSHGSDGTPVEAVPDTGYHFVDWSDSSTDNPRTDTNVTADITVTANFAIDEHGLTISSTNGGSVTAPGEGTYPYAYGTVVNLVATPAMGYGFVNWTGDVGTIVAVNSTTTTITMNDDYSITANFEPVAGVQTQCVESATNTGEACFTTSHGFIEDFQAIPPHSLPSVLFPHGMFDFRITGLTPGQTVTLTIEFPSPLPIGTLWWKYDNGRWYGLPNESDNGDNIMVISLTDGGVHDLDDVPGQITDPGGPGNPMTVGWEGSPIRRSAVAAPWLALLAVALCGASILVLRRRSEGRRDF